MTDPIRSISLALDGRTLPVQIRREGRSRSLHTGRDLEELHGWITTRDAELHGWLSGRLRRLTDRPVRTTDESGDFAGNWIVSWNSYAESGSTHTYTLILREHEELSLESLLLGGLELHPYEYRERSLGDGLAIWAKLVGTPDDLERLREVARESTPFQVVRRGINEQPRTMRLGVGEWSIFEDRVKYRLVLVDAEINEEMRHVLGRIEEENTRAALGFYESLVEHLTELLVERAVLSETDVAGLREAARATPGAGRRDFWRVPDVDAL